MVIEFAFHLKGTLHFSEASPHQAAERFYHGFLLTLTLYTPHSHRLSLLRSMAEQIDDRLIGAWPRATREERALFEKLKDAYIKARYSKHYSISMEELGWLAVRVETLGAVVARLCAERVESLEEAAIEDFAAPAPPSPTSFGEKS